jgi:hypothetical protein
VGYTISPSGDMQLPITQSAPVKLGHTTSGGVVSSIMSLTRRHSNMSTAGSSVVGALPPGGVSNGSAHAGSIGPTASGAGSLSAGLLELAEGSSMGGTSTPAAGSVVGVGGHEAVPPVEEGFVPNPVLANLERAFTADPRRHKRNDSQVSSQLSRLSNLSISSISK